MLDHASGVMTFSGKTVLSGDTIRFSDAASFALRVEATSTAGYVVSITSEPAAPPELASIQSFGEAAGRFLPLIRDEVPSDDEPVLPDVPDRETLTNPICTVNVNEALRRSLLDAERRLRNETAQVQAGLTAVSDAERAIDLLVVGLQGRIGSDVDQGVNTRRSSLSAHFNEVTTPRPHVVHNHRTTLPSNLIELERA